MQRKSMLRWVSLCLVSAWFSPLSAAQDGNVVPIIPRPLSVQPLRGECLLSGQSRIRFRGGQEALARIARLLAGGINACSALDLVIDSLSSPATGGPAAIELVLARQRSVLGAEGYELTIRPNGVVISAANEAGLFRGAQSIVQIVGLSAAGEHAGSVSLRCARVVDRPRFSWRGLLLDCGRHFMTKDFIKQTIDLLALFKMNVFHWHLTEDQGWRIQIRKYPRLTEIGAWRRNDDGTVYGGFYTQDDVREIVRYAAERSITVVPEIEMPGHCVAALASYPEYSCTRGPFAVQTEWGVHKDVYCAGNDSTFTFLEDVLEEVLELFPSPYIHIGGDEVPRERWSNCPRCQNRMRQEGLKSEDELQSYFIRRIERFLNTRGRRLVGWDEILQGGIAPNATVQSWRGMDGAREAVRTGHSAVASPSEYTYLNLAVRRVDLKQAYSFDPAPADMEGEGRVLGGEACLWTEYAPQEEVQEHLFPRLLAIAEVLWSSKGEFSEFSVRVEKQYALLDRLHVKVGAVSSVPVRITPAFAAGAQKFSVSMASSPGQGEVHYTLNGEAPQERSPVYTGPFDVNGENSIRARVFQGGRPYSELAECNLVVHEAIGTGVRLKDPFSPKYPGGGPGGLVDGVRGSLEFDDGRWQGYEGVNLDATVDLGREIAVDSIRICCLQRTGVWIFLPLTVRVEFSGDDAHYEPAGIAQNDLSPHLTGPLVKEFVIRTGGRSARFVHIVAQNRGVCPPWHPGAGAKSWVFADEIVVAGKPTGKK